MTDIATAHKQDVPVPAIASDLVTTMQRALAQNDRVVDFVNGLFETGLSQVYMVGAGGSLCATIPAQFALDQWEKDVSAMSLSSDEFTSRRPARLGPDALVIAASHSGKTAETLRVFEMAEQAGARTIAITRSAESPLGRAASLALSYESDTTIWPANQTLYLLIAYAIMDHSHGAGSFDPGRAAFASLATELPQIIAAYDDELGMIAESIPDDRPAYVLSSGPSYGAGYALAMCYLQEMQWLDAISLNAGEFFHGALEAVDSETPVITLLGDDATRGVAERAARFASTYSSRANVIDTAKVALPGIPAEERSQVSPVIHTLLVQRLVQRLSNLRGHSMKDRRYMGKVDY